MKLDLETIIKTVDKLKSEQPLDFLVHNFMPAQTMLKQGDKVYYSPLIKSGQVTVITLPEIEEPDLKINFCVNLSSH